MKSEFRIQVLAVLAIVISITALTIGFAAFSSTLTIEGTATVEASSWDVHFENLAQVALTGDAEEITAPTINTNDAVISDYDVVLKTPGDSVTYTFDVVNDGSYDAILSTFTMPTPTCTGTGDNATTDADNVCANVTYTLESAGGALAQGSTLAAGETLALTLTLTYESFDDVTLLPSEDVELSDLGIELIYSQN